MNRTEFNSWFDEAKNDLDMAKILLNSAFYNGSVFHSQQAAEKSVKASFFLFNIQPWGHSISKLLKDLEEKYPIIPKEIKKNALELDRHYTTTRYPDALPGITPKDAYDKDIANKCLNCANQILDFILKIPKKVELS